MSLKFSLNRSALVKSIILAGSFISPLAYSEDSTGQLYEHISKQESEISRLNKKIEMMKDSQNETVNKLMKKLQVLENKDTLSENSQHSQSKVEQTIDLKKPEKSLKSEISEIKEPTTSNTFTVNTSTINNNVNIDSQKVKIEKIKKGVVEEVELQEVIVKKTETKTVLPITVKNVDKIAHVNDEDKHQKTLSKFNKVIPKNGTLNKKETVVTVPPAIVLKKVSEEVKTPTITGTQKTAEATLIAVNADKLNKKDTSQTKVISEDIKIENKGYLQDEDTPESEKIAVAPEDLFKERFTTTLEKSTNPSETYLKALQAFSIEDSKTSITEFKRFIKYHSDHELIAKAHYWLGMSYIKQEPVNYSGARFEFMEVINRFSDHPNNDKKSKALYRLAQLSKINNYKEDIKKYTDMLNMQYPNSEEAKLSSKLLREEK